MKGTHQLIEGIGGVLFGDIGEMGVEGGGGGAAMAKQRLDVAQTQALLKQMGGQ